MKRELSAMVGKEKKPMEDDFSIGRVYWIFRHYIINE